MDKFKKDQKATQTAIKELMLSFEVKLKASQEVVDTKNTEIKELNDLIIKEKKENKGLILKHQVEINKFK